MPIRSLKDTEKLIAILREFHKICQEENLKTIGLSVPNFDNCSTLNEIKLLIKETFDQSYNITVYTDSRVSLSDKDEINKIITEFHESAFGGHQGISRTLKRIKTKYFWPAMKKDVTNFVRKCESCQKNKLQRNPSIPMLITSTSSRPFHRVALDIVGPLLLIFQDDLTKFSEAFPLGNIESDTIVRRFVEGIVCRHGIPDCLLSDRGANFLSNLFKDVCKSLRTKKLNTSPYHHQTNGALERSHRTLAEYLRHYVNKDPMTWDSWIPYAMFVYNTTPHTSTNFTPYELLYGFPPNIPISLKQKPQLSYNYDHYANELKSRLQHGYQIAREAILQNKIRSKTYYDKGCVPKSLNIGDKVLLKNHRRKDKFSSLWEGPFEVTNILSNENTEVKVGSKLKVYHNNDIKLFTD